MIPRTFFNTQLGKSAQSQTSADFMIIPAVPPQIPFKDLHRNKDGTYCLLDDKQVNLLLNLNLPDGKYTKNKAPIKGIPYNIISMDEELYIIYPKVIGKGAFGEVRIAQNLRSGEWYVQKRIDLNEEALKSKNKTIEQALKEIKDEHHILMRIDSSPRLSSKGFIGERESKHKGKQYLMLMKYAYGVPLNDIIDCESERGNSQLFLTDPLLSAETRLAIVGSILREARRIIEMNDIIHADIKPENIIIDINKLLAKYIDFGMAYGVDTKDKTHKTKNPAGTSLYLPRDILLKIHEAQDKNDPDIEFIYDEKTMVYALGVTLARLFNLFFVDDFFRDSISFNSKVNQNLLAEPCNDNPYIDLYIYNDSIEEEFRKRLIALFKKMLDNDNVKRPTLHEAITDFQKIKDDYIKEHPTDIIKVSIVNVNDYIKLDDSKKDEFLKSLKMGEVWLIDTGTPKETTVYISVRNDIENFFHRMRTKELIETPANDETENTTPQKVIIPLLVGDKIFFGETASAAKKKLQQYLHDRLTEDYSRHLTPASSKEIRP